MQIYCNHQYWAQLSHSVTFTDRLTWTAETNEIHESEGRDRKHTKITFSNILKPWIYWLLLISSQCVQPSIVGWTMFKITVIHVKSFIPCENYCNFHCILWNPSYFDLEIHSLRISTQCISCDFKYKLVISVIFLWSPSGQIMPKLIIHLLCTMWHIVWNLCF